MIVVAGPTSSGKSALSVRLAQSLCGEVISLDAVQVYQSCDIGSGKITEEETQKIPHHLLSLYQPNHIVSALEVVQLCNEKYDELFCQGIPAIIAAGSTMYLTMLLHGTANLPKSNREIKEKFSHYTNEELYAFLLIKDPLISQKLHVNDRQRVMRALEVVEYNNVSLSSLHAEHQFKNQRKALVIILCKERDSLYKKIEERCDRMLDSGFFQEVVRIYEEFGKCHALRSIGYADVLDVILGVKNLDEAVRSFKQTTRNYAKRQMTYLRNEPLKRGWSMLREDLHIFKTGGSLKTKKNQNEGNFKISKLCFDDLKSLIVEWQKSKDEKVSYVNLDADVIASEP